jgi:hypothetical protein
VLPGAREVVLRFREPARLEVSVRARSGEPVSGFVVHAMRAASSISIGLSGTEHPEPGRALVRAPSEPFVLTCVAPGFGPARSGVLDPAALPARWEVVLDPQAGMRGLVRASGEPVAGARVRLHAAGEPGQCHELDGYRLRMAAQSACETRTDSRGRFVLTPSEPGAFFVLVEADGHAPAERGPLAVSAAQQGAEVVIELDEGGVLEGRVLVAEGQSPEGIVVAVNRGDTFARTLRAGADGSFRFEGLAAGAYQVLRAERMRGGNSMRAVFRCERPELRTDCRVESGATTRHDLDLRAARPCVLAGVLRWGGAPASGWSASLWPRSGIVGSDGPRHAVLDELGAFTLSVPEPGEYRLDLARPAGGELTLALELARGTTPFELSLETAVLEIARAGSAGPPDGLVYRCDGEGWRFHASPPARGPWTLECPAGRGELGRHELLPGAQLALWNALLEVLVSPGERRALELP